MGRDHSFCYVEREAQTWDEERKRGIFDVWQDWVNEESMAGG